MRFVVEAAVAALAVAGLTVVNRGQPMNLTKAVVWALCVAGVAWFWGEIFQLCVGR